MAGAASSRSISHYMIADELSQKLTSQEDPDGQWVGRVRDNGFVDQ
jgi:hypothetical protein